MITGPVPDFWITFTAAIAPSSIAVAYAGGRDGTSAEARRMLCCAGYPFHEGGERSFEIDPARVIYGSGALRETGNAARELGLRRVAVFTDAGLARLEPPAAVQRALREAGLEFELYAAARVEPSDASLRDAAAFASAGRFDGFVSVGGGSVIDTAKAANLYSTYPADFATYVNAPLGAGAPVPGPLKPHIACPTTCGTGSEVTGIAIFDYLERRAKTGIASRRLRPNLAIVDPDCTASLPPNVVACSGFDVLSHALESYTALAYTRRPAPVSPATRPLSQGANPYSDLACVEALRIAGEYLERAVNDPGDGAARERLMWAATLAGIGFGNAGVHLPHAMAYAVAGLARDFHAPGYPPGESLVPHGMAVIVNAPASARFCAASDPVRHRHAAELLGADVGDASPGEAGEVLAERLEALMRATAMPNGTGGVGFVAGDVGALCAGAAPQRRLLANAPLPVGGTELEALFSRSLRYW